LAGRIDIGIHSMKDMESRLPEGLAIDHMLPRDDPEDIIIFKALSIKLQNMKDLPENIVIGTCGPRRAAFLRHARPGLRIVPLRGNVETRLEKLARRERGMGAIVLARAGLNRLGLAPPDFLSPGLEIMLPAAGQGAIGIEIRREDRALAELLN